MKNAILIVWACFLAVLSLPGCGAGDSPVDLAASQSQAVGTHGEWQWAFAFSANQSGTTSVNSPSGGKVYASQALCGIQGWAEYTSIMGVSAYAGLHVGSDGSWYVNYADVGNFYVGQDPNSSYAVTVGCVPCSSLFNGCSYGINSETFGTAGTVSQSWTGNPAQGATSHTFCPLQAAPAPNEDPAATSQTNALSRWYVMAGADSTSMRYAGTECVSWLVNTPNVALYGTYVASVGASAQMQPNSFCMLKFLSARKHWSPVYGQGFHVAGGNVLVSDPSVRDGVGPQVGMQCLSY